jgi:hypothetical protein
MSQQGVVGGLTQLARAGIDGLADSAEDPEKIVDQLATKPEIESRPRAIKAGRPAASSNGSRSRPHAAAGLPSSGAARLSSRTGCRSARRRHRPEGRWSG